jgi:hypothetical protein
MLTYGVEMQSFLSSARGRSSQLKALAALPPGKAPLLSVEKEAECKLECVWTLLGLYRGFISCPACGMAVVVMT